MEYWARFTFIEGSSPLVNPVHEHLQQATIGFLWTNVPNSKGMANIVGTAEMPVSKSGWSGARAEFQLRRWFGHVPDFIITLYAPYFAQASNGTICALTEHELCHCAQKLDAFGAPKFKESGEPAFGIRAHDVEEFVTVVDRYGPGHAAGKTMELVHAALRQPSIMPADIDAYCGTCARKLAA